MKRELFNFVLPKEVCGCCPGHDTFPGETYNCRTSEHARARDKRKEHKLARTYAKRATRELLEESLTVNDDWYEFTDEDIERMFMPTVN